MEQNYYIIINGLQEGPMSIPELMAKGLGPDSMVWREGLTDWTRAKDLPELEEVLNAAQTGATPPPVAPQHFPPVGNPYQSQPYGAPDPAPWGTGGNPYERQPIPHKNWLTAAICATVLGCLFSCIGLIFGIIAITQANSANNAYARGDKFDGDRLNSSAKTWTIVTFFISGLGIIGSVIWVILSLTSAFLGF